MSLIFQVLAILKDGRFHSGEDLAQQLHVSRARIWQAVKALRAKGLEIAAVTGRGYKIFDGIELLDKDHITANLAPAYQALLPEILIYPETHSTNSVLLEKIRQKSIQSGTVCLAEYQTSGRGRLGRAWVSPLASNIYCSINWQFQQGAGQLMGLSLIMGLAVVKALNASGAQNIGLKWPNDIYHHNKKLGGILVEFAGDALGPCDVVIGIGINVHMPQNTQIDQAYTDLNSVLSTMPSRNQIAANLIASVYDYLQRFSLQNFTTFLPEWRQYDILYNQTVTITQGTQTVRAIVTGIDECGQLTVNINGKAQVLTSAQASVRLEV